MKLVNHEALLAACAVVGLALCSCKRDVSSSNGAQKPEQPAAAEKIASCPLLATPSAVPAAKRFEKLDPETIGIGFVNSWSPPAKYRAAKAHSSSGAGVTVGDIDGDGLKDVYYPRPFGGGRMYRNLGDFRFDDVTDDCGLADPRWGSGATFVDIDNDADLDLYVCGYDCANRLYINDGSGKFSERASEFGLDFTGASIMMSFADYDRDGDLDGFLVTNRFSLDGYQLAGMDEANRVGSRVQVVNGQAVFPPDLAELYGLIVRGKDSARIIKAGQYARLFRNDGKAGFVDVARQAGIIDNGLSLSASWWDYDQDGWPDLYLANDFFGADRLFRNKGDGTFVDVAGDTLPHTPWMSMGADMGDLNGDGLVDFIATDMSGTNHFKQKLGMGDMNANGWFLEIGRPRQYMRNAVYLNTDGTRMMEVSHLTGLANSDWTWSPKVGDLDNDGDLDLFVTNGVSGDWNNSDLMVELGDLPLDVMLEKVPPKFDENLAFENTGGLKFKSVGADWGVDELSRSYGAALADLDNDGDLDILTNDFDAPPLIYRNQSSGMQRIVVSLRGQQSNRYGVGARVEVTAGDKTQVRYLTLARGFMSTNAPELHFGLGASEMVDRLTIHWPSGGSQSYESLEAGQRYVITEPATPTLDKGEPAPGRPMLVQSPQTIAAQPERPFDDFAIQPLLPNQLSQLGPAMAVADIDADGDEDLFVGGPAGQPGRLHLNQPAGYDGGSSAAFSGSSASEDMGALFFDADGDGDQDLYVASGGVECQPGDALLRDRLYLNDGQGGFSLVPSGALPDIRESSSCVNACDFDRDGDLDLFVGARVIPGQYPRTPKSYLLVNESTPDAVAFTDATDSMSSGLRESGLVTCALWSDVDGDGWVDLLVGHEWGPVKIHRNEQGKLVDRTTTSGIADLSGWWNGIAGGDIDNDGDTDYVVSNFGLNTKYHVSKDQPAMIFYHDFDTPGEFKIVEAHPDADGNLLPVRGRSCSSDAMPFISKKFPTFKNFAAASLQDVYGGRGLDDALKVEAIELRSMLLRNGGDGRFSAEPLPRMAQASPGFGVVLFDVDADAHLDVFIAQNFFGSQRETGRMDGGLATLLRGDGSGGFEVLTPKASGIEIPGDAMSAVLTDQNSDGVPDLLVGLNGANSLIFNAAATKPGQYLRVKLVGSQGNRLAIGGRLKATFKDGTEQIAEVYAGGGYLSQGSSDVWFGRGAGIEQITVRWPDGSEQTFEVDPAALSMSCEKP